MSAEGVIDWDEAMEQCGDDEEFLRELLADLRGEVDQQVKKIDEMLTNVSGLLFWQWGEWDDRGPWRQFGIETERTRFVWGDVRVSGACRFENQLHRHAIRRFMCQTPLVVSVNSRRNCTERRKGIF